RQIHGSANHYHRQTHQARAPKLSTLIACRRILGIALCERSEIAAPRFVRDALGERAPLLHARAIGDQDPGPRQLELLALLELELAIQASNVLLHDANATLQTHVDKLGFEQLTPKLFAVLAIRHAGAASFGEQVLDTELVLRDNTHE